jgi:hypothetical protein
MSATEAFSYRGYEVIPRREWSQWCVHVYPMRSDLPLLPVSTLSMLMPRKAEAVAEAKKRIDGLLWNSR